MSDFRIKFRLDDETTEKFSNIKNKSATISDALKWYLSFGRDSLERLTRIESMLASGVGLVQEKETIEVKRDEIDDMFDEFMVL